MIVFILLSEFYFLEGLRLLSIREDMLRGFRVKGRRFTGFWVLRMFGVLSFFFFEKYFV